MRNAFFAAIATVSLCQAPRVLAQEPGFQLEEIIVTARRTEENLQSTPISVAAFSDEELNLRGIQDVVEVGSSTPNVYISTTSANSGSSNSPEVFIRGIGLADFTINTEPAVGIYVDGVYLGRSVGSVMELVDLERVEVLRGPQGTLFGRNNIGGAIQLITARPHDEFAGKVKVGFGEDGYQELAGSINIPVSDSVAARVSFLTRERDGYVDALQYDDLKLGSDDVNALRAVLTLNPSDNLQIDISADYSTSSETPAPVVSDIVGRGALVGSSEFGNGSRQVILWNANQSGVSGCFDGTLAYTDATETNPACHGGVWSAGTGSYASNAVWFDRNLNKFAPGNELDVKGINATITYNINDSVEFKSITSHREFDSSFYNDIDKGPLPVFQNNNNPFDQKQFSQEFQLNMNLMEGRLNGTVGAFYFREEGEENVEIIFGAAPFGPIPTPPGGPVNAFDNAPGFFQDNNRLIDNTSLAFFAQFTYDITEDWRLTVGARHTDSEKVYNTTLDRTDSVFGTLGPVETVAKTKEVTPLVTLGWDARDDVYAYFTYSEGFRDGGFPSRFTGGLPDPLPEYAPEFVTSYELGVKSDITDNLRLNLSYFITDYRDYQVTAEVVDNVFNVDFSATDNLGEVRLDGLELELMVILSENLRVDWGLGLLNNSIESVIGGALATQGYTITTESELPYAPDYTSNLGITWNYPLDNGAGIRTRIDIRSVGSQYFIIENAPFTEEGSYHSVNASVTYESADGAHAFTIGGHNITDEDYHLSKFVGDHGFASSVPVRPATFFASYTYNWGE